MKRKLLSVLLTFCLAFSLLPTAALADGEGTPALAEVSAAAGTALPASPPLPALRSFSTS